MTRNEKLLLAAAVILVVFGLFMVLGAVLNIVDPKERRSVAGYVALLLIAGVLPIVLGAWLFWRTRMRMSRRALESREHVVLQLAGRHHGTLTVAQVAEESNMTLDQAKEILDLLYRKSYNHVSLTDTGEMVYTFPLE